MIDSPGSGVAACNIPYPGCTCPTVWHGIYPPPPCDFCRSFAARTWTAPSLPPVQPAPLPQRLSDDDVERIARRVAEILKEPAAS